MKKVLGLACSLSLAFACALEEAPPGDAATAGSSGAGAGAGTGGASPSGGSGGDSGADAAGQPGAMGGTGGTGGTAPAQIYRCAVSFEQCDGTCLGTCRFPIEKGSCEDSTQLGREFNCFGTCEDGLCKIGSADDCTGECQGLCTGICQAQRWNAVCDGECIGTCERETPCSAAGGAGGEAG